MNKSQQHEQQLTSARGQEEVEEVDGAAGFYVRPAGLRLPGNVTGSVTSSLTVCNRE